MHLLNVTRVLQQRPTRNLPVGGGGAEARGSTGTVIGRTWGPTHWEIAIIMSAADFVQRWRRRASESPDPFDRFFSAWIALIVAARGHLDEQQLSQPDTDRKAIIQYFESQALSVAAVLGELQEQLRWLAQRRGTGTGQPILDMHSYSPQHLRHLFDDLAQVWSGGATRKPRWVANATAEMINHIRNHMFHGLKAPDDAADQELLQRVNLILIGVLEACEPGAG